MKKRQRLRPSDAKLFVRKLTHLSLHCPNKIVNNSHSACNDALHLLRNMHYYKQTGWLCCD